MTNPFSRLLMGVQVVAFATLLLPGLTLLADTLPEEAEPGNAEPLPAPPLQLDTRVKVFPPLGSSEATAPEETARIVEVPPVVEGSGFLQRLLGEPTALLLPLFSPDEPVSGDSELDVPTVVSEPAEPIVPPPTAKLSVMLDWYLNPQHALLLVAREKGMFQRRGLDVNLVTPADPNVPAKLLAAGRTDLIVGRQPQLHLLIDQGLPLVRVATLVATPLSGLMLRDTHADETALEGLRLGFTDSDGRDVMLATAMAELLRTANGMELVELEDVHYSVLAAMRDNSIEGAMIHHRFLLPGQLADEGVATRILPIEELGLPVHEGLILMANRDRLNGKRDEVSRLVLALEEAAQWVVNHPDEAWQLLEKAEPALADPASHEAWLQVLPRFSLQPAAIDHGRYLRMEQFLYEAGIVEAVTPSERLAIDLGLPAP